MSLIATSHCLSGEEEFVGLALRESLSDAMLYGNRANARKLVHVGRCCECGKGVFIVVGDQGQGLDPNKVPDLLAFENLRAEHGRGIHLMKLAMDEIYFERERSEIHMRKILGLSENRTPTGPRAAWTDTEPHETRAR
jgi:serine/threonine-protein kinase RsbW